MGKPCPKHTAELKRRAVQPRNEGGTAYAEVAREIGVDPSGLADWVRRAPVFSQVVLSRMCIRNRTAWACNLSSDF